MTKFDIPSGLCYLCKLLCPVDSEGLGFSNETTGVERRECCVSLLFSEQRDLMRAIVLCFCMVTVVAACQRQTTEPEHEPIIVAPELIAPPDSSIFSHFPRITTFQWKPVSGASYYFIEVQYYADGGWQGGGFLIRVDSAEYVLEFFGAQPGRWRVRAVSSGAIEGPPSEWWYFFYTI